MASLASTLASEQRLSDVEKTETKYIKYDSRHQASPIFVIENGNEHPNLLGAKFIVGSHLNEGTSCCPTSNGLFLWGCIPWEIGAVNFGVFFVCEVQISERRLGLLLLSAGDKM